MQHKTCTKCHDCKPIDQFPKKAGKSLHGVASQCKECYKKINRESYLRNQEHIIEKAKKRYHDKTK